jgi:hypothetical protein
MTARGCLRACAALVLVGVAREAAAQRTDSLSRAEADSVARQLLVVREWRVEGAPWPHVRLYRYINASPEQSAAMLADYEHQKDYIVDLKEATIVRRLDSARTHVFFRYASNVAFVSDITYTMHEEIRRDAVDSYVIAWRLVEGAALTSAEGSARFQRWRNPVTGADGTLLVYEQFIVPSSALTRLPFVRGKAGRDVRRAVDAIAAQVEREAAGDKPLLARQVTALRAVLGPRADLR